MVQSLLQLDKLWSLPTTSVGGLPVAIALPVFEAISFVFTTQYRIRKNLTNLEVLMLL